MSNPTYLFQRNNTYYFRARIPAAITLLWNTKELCISLRTSDKHEAMLGSAIIAKVLQRNMQGLSTLPKKPTLRDIYFIAQDANSPPQMVAKNVDAHNPAEVELLHHLASKLVGSPSKDSAPLLSFSKLKDAYLKELEKQSKHSALESCTHTFYLFQELMGDLPSQEITQGKLGEFKRLIAKLPVGYSKKAAFKGKPLNEIISSDETPISIKTISNHVGNMVSLSLWARGNYDGIPELTAKGITPSKTISPDEERDAFSNEDLVKLFSPEHFDPLNDAQKWLVRLGALTGARIEEICQLDLLTDIRQSETGIWYISINTEGDKSVKTASGKRDIPLHSKLIELGVLEYFKDQRDKGATHPFELKWKRYDRKWSKYPSKWFGRYKTKVLGDVDGKVFHSFRHTVVTSLKMSTVPEPQTSALVGHSSGTITYSRYGKSFGADQLKSVVELLDFPVR